MLNLNISSGFKFSKEPFPAFRSNLVFGRNKFDSAFLPVAGNLVPNDKGLLEKDTFSLIKTKEKGTLLLIPQQDTSNRVLLFVGESAGFRGGISFKTTGTVIKECCAGNACEGFQDVIVLMEKGQEIVFHKTGRRHNDFIQFVFDGEKIVEKTFSSEEWDQKNQISETVEGEKI